MSRYIRRFRSLLNRNETIKGLILVGVVLLGAFLVWGGIRLALNTEYPVLVVSSASMCPPESCTLQVGALIVIKGQSPDTIQTGPPCGERAIGSPVQGSIIVFRPYTYNPDYLVVHRVRERIVTPAGLYGFRTQGDNFHTNGTCDSWSGDPSRGIPVGYVPENQVVGVYQYTIPIPYLGPAILIIRDFMGQPAGIAVVVILIVALFALEVIEPSKKKPPPPPSQPPTSPGRSDERPEPLITDPDS